MKNIYKSKTAAIENVRRFFTNTSGDVVPLLDAFQAWGRPNPEDMEKNKAWLSTALMPLKYHNLIIPIYSYSDGRKKLEKLQLTLEGKRALGRINTTSEEQELSPSTLRDSTIQHTITDVMKIVAKLRKDNPEFEITFDVKLRVE